MDRQQAIQKLSTIVGQDLRTLAEKYEVTVFNTNQLSGEWRTTDYEIGDTLIFSSTDHPQGTTEFD